MNTFKNKNTEICYVFSFHNFAELFKPKDKTTNKKCKTH
ncbi:hypothetical protein HmCmsJML022_00245 [Escherichia coli]|nr:hypothetical protein HmCmsJML022_00245 [Escherichia coli]